MSMNLYVEATTSVNGIEATKEFELWQTSTKLTREALRSEYPRGVYEQWVREMDLECGEEHLTELAEFLSLFEGKPEWTIQWFER